MTPEGRVKKQIRDYLKSVGAYQFWAVQTGYGSATIDCLVCYKGQFYGIEVKRPDTRPAPTPRQETVLEEIAKAGGGRIVAYDVEDVRKVLQP